MALNVNGGAGWLNSSGEQIQEEEASWVGNQEHGGASLQFKPMLESDWFSNQTHPQDFRFLGGFPFNPNDNLFLDSSSSQAFSLDTSQPSFLTANNKCCLLNVPNSDTNPFDNAFDFGSDSCFLGQGSSVPDFLSARSLLPPELQGFTSPEKVLKPLEVVAPSGAQPTLFQKRAAMRQSSGSKFGNSERKLSDDGEIDESGVEISGLHYESDELNESLQNRERGGRGKKKGMPAKNLS